MKASNRQASLIIGCLIIIGTLAGVANHYYKQQRQPDAAAVAESVTVTPASLIGQYRPDFTLPDDIGVPYTIDQWQGKSIVLNFWATWCRPCLQEIPMFTELQQQLHIANVQFIGVAIDDRVAVETFFKRSGIDINYPILIGDDDAMSIAASYGNATGILPYTVIINPEGIIEYIHFGEVARAELLVELQVQEPG